MTREHTPRPGITWETALTWTETTDPVDDGNPFAWHDDEPSTATPDHLRPGPPQPNRATRRAAARAARRRKDT